MKKKFLSLTLATAMMMTCMVGCGNKDEGTTTEATTAATTETASDTSASETSASETSATASSAEVNTDLSGEITVLTNRTDLVESGDMEKLYAAEFNKVYPNVKVNYESMEDYEGDVSTRLSSGDYGDVLMIPNTIPQEEYADFFEPFGTVDELSATYKGEYLYSKENEGVVYGLPSGINTTGVLYNKAVFEQAGIDTLPTTPEEFLDDLQKIKDNTDAIPLYTNTHDAWCVGKWYDYVSVASGDGSYKNNTLCNEKDAFSEGKPAYQVYKILFDAVKNGLVEEDPFTTEWEGSKAMMNNGEIGCMVLGSWAIPQMQAAGDNADDIGYMAFPIYTDGKGIAGAGADYCYGINAGSENKEAAKAYVDFMINNSTFAADNGMIPLGKDAAMPESLADMADVTLMPDDPATEENAGKLDKVMKESELALGSGSEYEIAIVEAATGNSDKSFDDIMNEWNEKWNAAIDAVEAE